MVTVSHLVQEHVNMRPLLQEAMIEGIVNYALLAEKLKPAIEKKLRKRVKLSAIVMALRRHSEGLANYNRKANLKFEIIIKTNLVDIAVHRTPGLPELLKKIQGIVSYEKGDTLNIINGNYEISVVVSEKYSDRVLGMLSQEKVITVKPGLVSLALTFSERFYDTPGVVAKLTRKLAWENINVVEIISTYTELNFIIDRDDLTRAYEVLAG